MDGLLTEAFVIAERDEVTFDVLYDAVGEHARRAILALGAAIVATMFLVALPTIYDYVSFLWRERTDALRWRLDWLYFCFVIYWAAVIVRSLARLVRLAGRTGAPRSRRRRPTNAPIRWPEPP